MYYYLYHAAMVLSLIISLSIIVLTWRNRQYIGAGMMLAMAAGTFVWTLGFFLESTNNTLEGQLFYSSIGHIGAVTVPVAWFLFSLRYTNIGNILHGWRIALLYIIPFISIVLIWSNDWHHLMWSNAQLVTYGDFLLTERTYGALAWVVVSYCYFLILVGAVVMLRRLFVGIPLYIGQAVSLTVAVALPVIGNIVYILNVYDLLSMPQKNLTPIMFAFSGIAITLGVTRFRLLSTIPFARKFIFQQLHDGVFIFDIHHRLVEANPAAIKMLSEIRNVIGKKLQDLLNISPVFECLSPVKFGRIELHLDLTGEVHYYELDNVPMLDDHKRQVGWLAIFRDITEAKKSAEQYRLVTENSADVIYKLMIKEECYTYVSPSVERVFGYTTEEALTMTPKMVLTPESYKRQYSELLKDLRGGTFHRTLQLEVVHKDGHIVPVEVHGSLVCDENGEPTEVVGVVRDITERKKMEEQLIMQDRLASIGQLTSGVAHELNNPLTSILSYSALLLQRELPEDVNQDVQTINEEAKRTARLVKNLLTFARKQPQVKQPTNINEGIKQVLELRAYEQNVSNIQIDVQLDPELPAIMGNSPQLQQVFFNIVINAEFFMLKAHDKGVLSVKTEKVGDFVRASFSDDGPGISEEDQKHLFTPFFTTKGVGQGTGLSLSICLGIVTEHDGRIWAESEEGKGSTFILELPVCDTDEEDDIA